MSTDQYVAVGVEIAGGKTTVALIDRHGQILQRCQAKTLRGRSISATLEPYVRTIDTMLAAAREQALMVCGIGVSVPGSINYATRRPVLVPTLPAFNCFPLCEFLESRYQLATRLYADVDAAISGEYHFGAGQTSRRVFLLTVNAVVGAALLVDGQLVDASEHSIGHICHLPVATTGPRCSCGRRGCINTFVSLDAVQKMLQRAVRRGEETGLVQRILNHEYFSPQLLAQEAERGDAVAVQIYNEVARWLGAAITRYSELFDPHTLILGGDVFRASGLLLAQIHTSLVSPAAARVCSPVKVQAACLGGDAALIGATTDCF